MHGAKKKIDMGIELLEKACINGEEPKACLNLEKVYRDGLPPYANADVKKADMYKEMSERILQYQEELFRSNSSTASQ